MECRLRLNFLRNYSISFGAKKCHLTAFEAYYFGSWKTVERLQIWNGVITMLLFDYGDLIEENVPISNLQIRSRKATLSDCTCFLRPGLVFCVLSTPQGTEDSSDDENQDPAEEAAIAALKRALGALSVHLASNTYLVGHAVTLASIIMTCNLFPVFTNVMTKSFTTEFPHVERYYWTMVNQPNFKKVIEAVLLIYCLQVR
ncbi:elongation factor 1-gamma-like [Camellia sinensis]|uniref:elongation factor 1-gamma-like n=1 Tax=Camellia sinensis TaxID=4442 RepID=UPI0010364791|nr:elongation factor 1-gamma-like [Camellia sinensis]